MDWREVCKNRSAVTFYGSAPHQDLLYSYVKQFLHSSIATRQFADNSIFWIALLINMKWPSLSLLIDFSLKSTLSNMSVGTLACLWGPFAWKTIFYPWLYPRVCFYQWVESLVRKQEETKSKTRKGREIIKIRTKINEINTKNVYKEPMKQKVGSLKRLTRMVNF
jgi:hypothetical protein